MPAVDPIYYGTVFIYFLIEIIKKLLIIGFRLVGCQDLMEDVGSRVSKHDNLLTVVTYPPDYKSLPRRGRGTTKYRGSRDDHVASMS